MSPVVVVLSWMCLPDQLDMSDTITGARWWYCAVAILLGLWSGLLIGFVTVLVSLSVTPRCLETGRVDGLRSRMVARAKVASFLVPSPCNCFLDF